MSFTEDDTSKYLSEYLTAIWADLEPDPALVSVQCCAVLLERNSDLRGLVEKACIEKDSNILKDTDLPRHPRQMIYNLEQFRVVFKFLETMRVPMEKIVDGTAFENLPRWNLKAPLAVDNPDVAEHIKKLNIHSKYPESEPLLLIHENGSFQSDPELNERLEQIFSPTRNALLVNSSGTGKTRLLYEGLCKHWGLFFTAVVDSYGLGSTDVYGTFEDLRLSRLPTPVLVGDAAVYNSEASLQNQGVARRAFSETLLARLLVFKLFVNSMAKGEIEEIHKTRWFLAQIQPLLFGGKYGSLMAALSWSPASDSLLADCISQCLEDIAVVFSRKSMNPHIFVVLDEANAMAGSLVHAFRDTHGPHPVLNKILETWNSHLRNKPFTIVVAGTDIPRMYFREDGWSQWHWISCTGAFTNINDQQRYILKFLPGTLVDSPSGQHLLHRKWVWLRGRHRFTAAFISTLVENGFQSPHYLMNTYLRQFTGFWPTDADEFLRTEVPRRCPEFDGLPLSQLDHLSLDILCVSMGFGHFIDNKMATISAEEPLVLVATAQWLSEKSLLVPDLDNFLSSFHFSDEPLVYKSDYLALATALCFKAPHLICDIFSFSTSSLPVWASQHARLVALRGRGESARETVVEYSPRIASQLVFTASHAAEDATTLYFILRLEDYTRCWVALRAVPDDDDDTAHIATIQGIGNGMTSTDLLAEDDTSNEGVLEEALRTLPDRHPEIGLLRVLVSLHDKINLEELEFDTSDTYPVVSFNIPMIRDAMKNVSQKDVLSGLVVSIISDIGQHRPPETESEPSVSYRPPTEELSAEASTLTVPSRRTKTSTSSKRRFKPSPRETSPLIATATRSTKRKAVPDVDSEPPSTGSRGRLSGPSAESSGTAISSRARRRGSATRQSTISQSMNEAAEESDIGRTLRGATTRTTRPSSSVAGAKRSRLGDDDNSPSAVTRLSIKKSKGDIHSVDEGAPSHKSTIKSTQDRSGPNATRSSPRKILKSSSAADIAPKSTGGRSTEVNPRQGDVLPPCQNVYYII
ncbi:hypothetical protein BDP27DRAFT_1421872 [Rhodocollybia butyracea]|uniref:Uncharacterized protein n=1 Tax=Rhodocollybia butyracea TaxID=206335 RepID=A0A9P5U658_9AGAR|nr:hypothetical protein BDP27DRAFT_1421872 [Rhodocollybia butyracea]